MATSIYVNNWLVQIFVILFNMILFQAYFKKIIGFKHYEPIALGILSALSIFICMTYPVHISNGYVLDFRYIPLILSFVYGGFNLGLTLTIFTIAYRIYLGGIGIYLTLFICLILIILFKLTLKRFIHFSQKNKFYYLFIVLFFTIVIFASGVLFLGSYYFSAEEIIRWIVFVGLNLFTMWVIVYIHDSLNQLDILKMETEEREKMHLIGELSSTLSNQLHKPLNLTVDLLRELNLESNLPFVLKNKINLLEKQYEKVLSIYNEVAKFTDNSVSKEIVNVVDEMGNIINMIEAYASLHQVSIFSHPVLNNNLILNVNKGKFQQLILNLIRNAIEASPLNGKVELAIYETLSSVVIIIEDEGNGLSKDQMMNLGQAFNTNKENHNGLGILVSYNLIRSMGGKIEINPNNPKGTSVSVFLPQYEEKN